ncbi:MAG: hypothetical protein ACHQ51_13080 [Elusimicrobiota bacterium]
MTSALVALIAATLLRLAMLRYQVTVHATNNGKERRYDEAALAMLVTQWNTTNVYCASVSNYYTCSGTAVGYAPPLTSCNCTCNVIPSAATTNFPQTITALPGAPPCQLTILSTDM